MAFDGENCDQPGFELAKGVKAAQDAEITVDPTRTMISSVKIPVDLQVEFWNASGNYLKLDASDECQQLGDLNNSATKIKVTNLSPPQGGGLAQMFLAM